MLHQLPERTRQLLNGSMTRDTTFKAIGSVAFTCYRREFQFEQFSELVWSSELGRTFVTEQSLKTRAQFNKQLRRAWDYTEDNFDHGYEHEAAEYDETVRERLADLLTRVQAAPWPGRGGNSERATAVALVTLGHETNRYTVDASVRELATRAMIGRTAVGNALGRLATHRLFTRTRPEVRGDSDTFHLELDWVPLLPISGHTKLYGSQEITLCVPVLVLTEHPAFSAGALGKSAGRIWEFLLSRVNLEVGPTVGEIQAGTGLSANSVRAHLKKMVANGLADKQGQRNATYAVSPRADLDRVAAEYGQADYEERTRARFERERQGYAALRRQQEQPADVA
ncbi:hypothetical protein ACFVAV_23345 [Nocardia sp. NPDC057663]|uniref:hypothetical protein n=1 Tax=Nocardia sp. NPDC057663 TaxID=3346201 RepID=UPI0036730E91